jgi:hypothetical protein
MKNISLFLNAELRRLPNGPTQEERPSGIGTVRFLVRCPFGANDVLARVKNVLEIVDVATLAGWPINEKSAPRLPEWFTSACAPEMSPEQAKQWLAWWKTLPPEDQVRTEIEKDWSLENWLYWMEPDNRQWFWWDAKVLENYDHIALAIEVKAWPFPWGELRWLFRAAGASAVEAEE